VAWGAHDDLFLDFLCTNTLVPGGPIGWELKLYCPWACACADKRGLIRDPLSRLRVSRAWGMSRSHRCSGNSLSVDDRPAMKWFLNVRMALSAVLRRCIHGGASWNSTFSSWKYCLRLEHSLSSRQSFGVSPACLSRMKHVL
jgi:hypothetical protein